eukprot:6469801-Amphidinium_carterae.3
MPPIGTYVASAGVVEPRAVDDGSPASSAGRLFGRGLIPSPEVYNSQTYPKKKASLRDPWQVDQQRLSNG